MELKFRLFLYLGILVAVSLVSFFFFYKKKKKTKFTAGVKISDTFYIENDRYYIKKKTQYKILSLALVCCISLSIIFAAGLCARPYTREQVTEEKYCRDIILCLDVSTSVDEVNLHLVGELVDMVQKLKGERFGIIIFNTSSVLLSPLTDDYEYIIECLENIKKALKIRLSSDNIFSGNIDIDEWLYWDAYISEGTLVGNDKRGSSLIGDGLASAINNFSKYDTEKTKIIILATDNDPYGKSFVPLNEGAEICVDRNITVYGIGTSDMTTSNREEMKKAVEYTGGEFFIGSNSATFPKIVESIKAHSENLVADKSTYKDVDKPEVLIILTVLFSGLSLLCAGLLKK